MQYTTFKKTGQKISLLGMGTMRLPQTSDGKVDEPAAIALIRKAIDNGINYVDTAYMYHDGESEVITGKALQDGYREKVLLADKMPVWMAKDPEGMAAIFETQLQRLGTQVIDMYLIHNLTVAIWERCQKFGLLPYLEEQKRLGRIHHIGFSFHDELPFFKELIDAYPWDFCQIQLNYMDKKYQAGLEGLQYAESKGIPVIVMEPLKGGKLTDRIPPVIEKIWAEAKIKRSPADWAFRWVADLPGILTILSGMSAEEQLDENLNIFSRMTPPLLTEEERQRIDRVSTLYNELIPHSCTACKYCLPCPQKIDIPSFIELFNEWHVYEHNPKVMVNFGWWFPKYKPSLCTGCKVCEGLCPQHLPISRIMSEGSMIFEGIPCAGDQTDS
jgi:uncharacterized protein